MLIQTFVPLLALTLSYAAPTAPVTSPSSCSKILTNGGVSKNFYMSVAHVVHSMTVDELKKFDPLATEANFVPTVNRDLKADQAILPYAPDFKGKDDSMFLTEGMKTLDLILSHTDQKNFDIKNFTPLKLVVHAFHMKEVWAHVLMEYQKIGSNITEPSKEFCECAMDLDNNGVMRGLRLIGMATREPGLYYGDPSFSYRKVGFVGVPLADTGYHWTEYRNDLIDASVSRQAIFGEDKIQQKPLSNSVVWDLWKSGGQVGENRLKQSPEQLRDAALFLHCAVQKGRGEN